MNEATGHLPQVDERPDAMPSFEKIKTASVFLSSSKTHDSMVTFVKCIRCQYYILFDHALSHVRVTFNVCDANILMFFFSNIRFMPLLIIQSLLQGFYQLYSFHYYVIRRSLASFIHSYNKLSTLS